MKSKSESKLAAILEDAPKSSIEYIIFVLNEGDDIPDRAVQQRINFLRQNKNTLYSPQYTRSIVSALQKEITRRVSLASQHELAHAYA